MVAYKKVWEFFWNTLTFGEKCAIEVGLLVVAGFIASGGYWFGEKFSQSRLEQQRADSSRKMATFENKIADLERKLSESGENEPTLETAKPANRTYLDFVNALNVARGKDPLTVIAFIDQYRGKKVRWDCTILHTNAVDKWYTIGENEKAEPKNRAFAQFRSDEFDRFLNEGGTRQLRAYSEMQTKTVSSFTIAVLCPSRSNLN